MQEQLVVTMEQQKGFEFLVKFDEGIELLMDEPKPLGEDNGPSASKVLSAAVGNCLSASLLFCLQKARVHVRGIKTRVTTRMVRNEKKRLRVGGSHVTITVDADRSPAGERFKRCLDLFEDFCVVTASVRGGMDVSVEVVDPSGEKLYDSKD